MTLVETIDKARQYAHTHGVKVLVYRIGPKTPPNFNHCPVDERDVVQTLYSEPIMEILIVAPEMTLRP